jgi:excinuclease UvrABC nuclease subunit
MQRDAFHLGKDIRSHSTEFKLYPPLWDSFDIPFEIMNSLSWKEHKFLNEAGDDFSDEIKNLPNDKGGIYIFIIKSRVLPTVSEYLAYIGRAQLTENHSLRIRCRKYLNEYLKDKERPKITRMIEFFKNHLFLRYAEINDNNLIIDLEAKLINSILPPFNDKIPDKRIRDAVTAFN